MSRASSASLYGGGAMDLSRALAMAPRYPHGLRSESAPDGYYSGPQTPRKRTVRRASPVRSNRPDPAVAREVARLARIAEHEANDVPMIRYGSAVATGLPSIGLAMANDN